MRTRGKNAEDRAAILAQSVVQPADLEEALATATQHKFFDGAHDRAVKQEQISKLAAFDKNHSLDVLNMLQSTFPAYPWDSKKLVLLPGSGPTVLLPALPSVDATQALAWATSSRASNLATSLEAQWVSGHQLLQQTDCKSCNTVPVPKQPCRQAHTCICDQAGKLLLKFKNKVIAAMKAHFKTKEDRSLLTKGEVVLCLQRLEPCQHDEVGEQPNVVWLHISHMSLSPFSPVFSTLKRLDDAEHWWGASPKRMVLQMLLPEKVLQEDTNELRRKDKIAELFCLNALQALMVFHTDLVALKMLCRQCQWQLRFYRVEDSARPVPCLKPDIVTVQADGDWVDFWPPRRGVRRQRGWRASNAASAASEAGLDMGMVSDEDKDEDEDSLVQSDAECDEEVTNQNADLIEAAAAWEPLHQAPNLPEEQEQTSNHQVEVAEAQTQQVDVVPSELVPPPPDPHSEHRAFALNLNPSDT
eukprot:4017824-Amphidinium_carterae.3